MKDAVEGRKRLFPRLANREKRLLEMLGAASFFSLYDEKLLSLLLLHIQESLVIPEAQVGLLGATVRAGAVPAFLALILADRIGRRTVLLWTIVGYTLATGATAFAPNYQTFVVCQMVSRLFMGAEFILAMVVIVEELEPEHRGFGIGVVGMLAGAGAGAAMALFSLVDSFPMGWRGLYLIGLGPLVFLVFLRRGLPETARFQSLQRDVSLSGALRGWFEPIAEIVRHSPGRFAAVAVVSFLWSASNAPVDFLFPKFAQEMLGWTPAEVAKVGLLAGAVGFTGFVVVGALSDRYGRKTWGVLFLVLEPALAVAMFSLFGAQWVALLYGTWVFASVANDVVLRTFRSELFPTSHRATAAGAVAIVGGLGAVIGLVLETTLFAIFAEHWTPVRILALTGLAMPLIVFLRYPETSGRSLDEISPEI